MKTKLFEQNIDFDEVERRISSLNPFDEEENLSRVSDLWEKLQSIPVNIRNVNNLETFKKIYFYDKANLEKLFDYLKRKVEPESRVNLGIGNSKTAFVLKYKLTRPKSVFVGTYKDISSNKLFFIKQKRNKLIFGDDYQDVELSKNTDGDYEGTNSYKLNVYIQFNDSNPNSIKAEITLKRGDEEKTYITKKINSSTEEEEQIDEDEWSCINEYNKSRGYILLSQSADGSFKFQNIKEKRDNRDVQLVFYSDGKLKARFADDSKDIPRLTGTWECGGDGKSYIMKWDSGQVVKRGVEAAPGFEDEEQQNSATDDQKPETEVKPNLFKQACGTNIKKCPTKDDVLKNKAAYSICMKCPEIKDLQDNVRFNTFYKIRLKAINLPETTDEYFGPAMRLAVQDFQASNGLLQTGTIGKYTYERITQEYKPVQFVDDKQKTEPPKVDTLKSKEQTKINKEDKWLRPDQEL